jgi:hypothetical protein
MSLFSMRAYGARRKRHRYEGRHLVKKLKMLGVVVGLALLMPVAAQSAEETAEPAKEPAQSSESAATPPKCLKAAVNPVTGHAICLEPKGAPVDPPERSALQRPCKPRARDDDAWAMYEHWSGCHD